MLSPEDSLRLNVLLKQELHALRIDEGKMRVHALTERGDATVALNPNAPNEPYLRQVRELISSQILGVPHGYPAYLKRWTRMGQARTESLAGLLKLGEPEAVMAVVYADGLTDELARRAWWILQSSEHARAMLRREVVVQGPMGRVLAEFLVEFLAYEADPARMVESVRLLLQPGLIGEAERLELWSRGQRRIAYRVGFLKNQPHALPESAPAHPRLEPLAPTLAHLGAQGNAYATQLQRLLEPSGQVFLATVGLALSKCSDQGVVVHLFEALEQYFTPVRPQAAGHRRMADLLRAAASRAACIEDPERRRQCLELQERLAEEDQPLLEGLLVFAGVGEPLLAPIFGNTDAVGSGLRRVLEPVTQGLFIHLQRLQP